jgi:hypothetical protein
VGLQVGGDGLPCRVLPLDGQAEDGGHAIGDVDVEAHDLFRDGVDGALRRVVGVVGDADDAAADDPGCQAVRLVAEDVTGDRGRRLSSAGGRSHPLADQDSGNNQSGQEHERQSNLHGPLRVPQHLTTMAVYDALPLADAAGARNAVGGIAVAALETHSDARAAVSGRPLYLQAKRERTDAIRGRIQ